MFNLDSSSLGVVGVAVRGSVRGGRRRYRPRLPELRPDRPTVPPSRAAARVLCGATVTASPRRTARAVRVRTSAVPGPGPSLAAGRADVRSGTFRAAPSCPPGRRARGGPPAPPAGRRRASPLAAGRAEVRHGRRPAPACRPAVGHRAPVRLLRLLVPRSNGASNDPGRSIGRVLPGLAESVPNRR